MKWLSVITYVTSKHEEGTVADDVQALSMQLGWHSCRCLAFAWNLVRLCEIAQTRAGHCVLYAQGV